MITDWDKRIKTLRRGIEDVADDAGDVYDNFRSQVGKRANRVWRDRDEYLDEALSYAEEAGDAVYRRMRTDPLGTVAIGIVACWLLGRMIRR